MKLIRDNKYNREVTCPRCQSVMKIEECGDVKTREDHSIGSEGVTVWTEIIETDYCRCMSCQTDFEIWKGRKYFDIKPRIR